MRIAAISAYELFVPLLVFVLSRCTTYYKENVWAYSECTFVSTSKPKLPNNQRNSDRMVAILTLISPQIIQHGGKMVPHRPK